MKTALLLAAAPLLVAARHEYLGYENMHSNPWTLAIRDQGPCKSVCFQRVVFCTGRDACERKNVYHKQACEVLGYNQVVECANCVIKWGLCDTGNVTETLDYLVGNCTETYGFQAATISAAAPVTSSITALSPTATGGSLNMPQPTAGAGRMLPTWGLAVAAAVLAATL